MRRFEVTEGARDVERRVAGVGLRIGQLGSARELEGAGAQGRAGCAKTRLGSSSSPVLTPHDTERDAAAGSDEVAMTVWVTMRFRIRTSYGFPGAPTSIHSAWSDSAAGSASSDSRVAAETPAPPPNSRFHQLMVCPLSVNSFSRERGFRRCVEPTRCFESVDLKLDLDDAAGFHPLASDHVRLELPVLHDISNRALKRGATAQELVTDQFAIPV